MPAAMTPEQTHPLTPGKPCPGGGLCCNRPEFDRAMFPCAMVNVLQATIDRLTRERDAATKAERAEFKRLLDTVRTVGFHPIAGYAQGWNAALETIRSILTPRTEGRQP